LNVVGGFVVTDRMLHMFKPRSETKAPKPETNEKPGGGDGTPS
jgi:hypothetical protein